ncbi:hypothetical protein FS749_005358 [Ceratobasidium sp. UAMH 11750]|nr:hypothetical protein FS749_005358 [Ceratobasidium sp. UAMH 11750]
MSSQQTNAASNRVALARLQELLSRVDRQDTAIASVAATNTAQGSQLVRHAERLQSLEKTKELTNQFSPLTHTELETHKKRMDYLESLVRFSYAAGNVVPPQGILNDADVDLIAANAAIGGGDDDAVDLSAREREIQKDTRLEVSTKFIATIVCSPLL